LSNGAAPTESSAHAPRPASIGFNADCSTRSRACTIHGFIARYFFFRFRFRYDAFAERGGRYNELLRCPISACYGPSSRLEELYPRSDSHWHVCGRRGWPAAWRSEMTRGKRLEHTVSGLEWRENMTGKRTERSNSVALR